MPKSSETEPISGAILLLQNLPQPAFCAIDLLSFTTTPKFQGIKNLPAGLHFVLAASTSEFSVRHGIWFRVAGPQHHLPANSGTVHHYHHHQQQQFHDLQVIVKRWDGQSETLGAVDDAAQLLAARANVGAVWREGLSPYRQSALPMEEQERAKEDAGVQDWLLLTEWVTDEILCRITGSKAHWALTTGSSAPRDAEEIPGLSDDSSKKLADLSLSFLPVDLKRTWRIGATGRERTEAARDHSWALAELISIHCHGDPNELLGEIQFCFLMVLTLNNYSCLEQWRRLLTLVFTSMKAVGNLSKFYVKLLRILALQLKRSEDVEGGLFDFSDDGKGQLRSVLRRFKRGLVDLNGTAKQDVLDEFEELETFTLEHFGWNIDDNYARRGMITLEDGEQVEVTLNGYEEENETGEYAPTIVDLAEDQLKSLHDYSDNDDDDDDLNNHKNKNNDDDDENSDNKGSIDSVDSEEDMDMRY